MAVADRESAHEPKAGAPPISPYDAVAASFDRHRALPPGVAAAIRGAVLAAIRRPSPRLLDLGAGTGRIGLAFVAAGDDYLGVDLSFGMLREFARRADGQDGPAPRLIQTDGRALPFADGMFDAVLLIQVLGAAQNRQELMAEARRVLRLPGLLIIAMTTLPAVGLDTRMKEHLKLVLAEMGIAPYHVSGREHLRHLEHSLSQPCERLVAAAWRVERTPRAFLDRQRTGAHFSTLPESTREEALCRLSRWAAATFGSLDAAVSERHEFELRVFRFEQGVER
jgi:ubiquinone/menaquinone biosynthesis C-methylase UbiE